MFGKIGIIEDHKTTIPMTVKNPDGSVESNEAEVLKRWKTDYEKLFNM